MAPLALSLFYHKVRRLGVHVSLCYVWYVSVKKNQNDETSEMAGHHHLLLAFKCNDGSDHYSSKKNSTRLAGGSDHYTSNVQSSSLFSTDRVGQIRLLLSSPLLQRIFDY